MEEFEHIKGDFHIGAGKIGRGCECTIYQPERPGKYDT
jgi:hypothetical protein